MIQCDDEQIHEAKMSDRSSKRSPGADRLTMVSVSAKSDQTVVQRQEDTMLDKSVQANHCLRCRADSINSQQRNDDDATSGEALVCNQVMAERPRGAEPRGSVGHDKSCGHSDGKHDVDGGNTESDREDNRKEGHRSRSVSDVAGQDDGSSDPDYEIPLIELKDNGNVVRSSDEDGSESGSDDEDRDDYDETELLTARLAALKTTSVSCVWCIEFRHRSLA